MLHLLPMRIILSIFGFITSISVVAVLAAGWLRPDDLFHVAVSMLRWSTVGSSVFLILLFVLWRWVPLIQEWIFPYIGGRWTGKIVYGSVGNQQTRDVTLDVKHTLLGLKLILDSDESSSRTLAVHAETDPDFSRYQLYYVYRNERKPGVVGAGAIYRGLAIMRIEFNPSARELHGDYFTETQKSGTLTLQYTQPTPFWKLWR